MDWFQLQQPTKLEDSATVILAKWITLYAEKIMKLQTDYFGGNEAISQAFEIIRNYLKYLPGMFKNKLLPILMPQMSDLISNFNCSYPILQQRKIIACQLLELLLSDSLTFLSLNNGEIKAFGAFFVSCSFMLTGLTSVKLDLKFDEHEYMPMEDDDNYEEFFVIEFFKEFRSLKYLMITNCTDNILRCIAENCTSLEKLDLYNYDTGTDDTIDLLTRLPNLESVNLYESPQHMYGEYEYRLFDSIKRKKLKYIASRKQFDLKSYVNYSATAEELKPIF